MNDEPTCTCPCIDCIEGNHCGGYYFWPDDNGVDQLIGECHHLPWDYDEKERLQREYEDHWDEQDDEEDLP